MLRLFNKIFFHECPANDDLTECSHSNYFTENDNYIDSYEDILISASERVTKHIHDFSDLKILIIADLLMPSHKK